eukprot:3261282-Heterocapsa_arctica.AAC.1
MADTNPPEEQQCCAPYEKLLCGRANSFFTAHAYGPQAKGHSPDFVEAQQASRQRPFALLDNKDLAPGEVNIFCPPPHQLNNCRGQWGHIPRYDGLTMYMRMPETPTPG